MVSETARYLPRSRSNTAPILVLIGVAVADVIVLLLGLVMGVRGWDVMVLLLALVTSLLAAGPIALDVARPPERRQLMISILTFVYCVFLVVPVFTQYFLMKGEPVVGLFQLSEARPADIAHAQVVALGGLLALLLGFYTPFGRIAASVIPRPTRDWTPQATFTIAVVTIGLGWLVYLPGQLGIIPSWFGSGALGTIASGSYLGISLLALAWLRHRNRTALLLLVLVVPFAMAFSFFTGSKRLVLNPPFMVALAYIVFERRLRTRWLVAGIAMLIVLYPFAQFYRDFAQTARSSGVVTFLQNPGLILAALSQFGTTANLSEYMVQGIEATGRRLDALGTLETIVRETPERVPYQGGWTIGLIFLSYVPRVLWPDKPSTTIGIWVSQTYGSPYDLTTNVGPTWIGELFFNWGYVGVGVGMFLLGVLFRVLHERVFTWNAPIPALFAATIVLYGCCRSVQSGVLDPINTVGFYVAPVVIAHVLVGLFGGYQLAGTREAGIPGAGRTAPEPRAS